MRYHEIVQETVRSRMLKNPSVAALLGLLRQSDRNELRGVVMRGDVWWWDAEYALHGDVARNLGHSDYTDDRAMLERVDGEIRFSLPEAWSLERILACPSLRRLAASPLIFHFTSGGHGWLPGPEWVAVERRLTEAVTFSSSTGPYWHGTNNTGGQRILASGFQGAGEVVLPIRIGKNYLPPTMAGVYLTADPKYALEFAGPAHHRQTYGWLFRVASQDLAEVEIDEDEIGLAVRGAYKIAEFRRPLDAYVIHKHAPLHLVSNDPGLAGSLIDLANRHLPAELIENLKKYNLQSARWLSDAGTILRPLLPDAMTMKFITSGCHLVSLAGIVPEAAWRFPRLATTAIHNRSLLVTIEGALAELAQKMR